MNPIRTRSFLAVAMAAALGTGCSQEQKQPEFAELHPVTGVVLKGGQPVKGGSLRFAADPDQPEFLVNATVGDDGKFTLTTVRTTDRSGERKTGAPAGKYKVTYTPMQGDQVTGGLPQDPVDLPTPVAVEARANDLKLELPAKRK